MNWDKKTLGAIYDEEGGKVQTGPFGSQLHESDYKDYGIPVIMPKDIKEDKLDLSSIARISEIDANRLKQHLVILNDIIFPRRGEINKRILIDEETSGSFCGTGCIRLRGSGEIINPLFLFYYLKQTSIVKWLENQAIGATMMNLNTTILRSIPINYPEHPTQKKIASILSAYDDLIENNNQRITLLEDMAGDIYKEWFVRFRFPNYQNTKFLDKDGNAVAHGTKGAIPEGWERKLVRDIVKRYNAGEKYDNKTALEKGNVPILDQGQSGLIGYHNDEPGVLASMDDPIIVFANHTCYQNLIQFNFSAIQNILPFKSNEEYDRDIFWLHYATKDLIVFNDYKGHWPEFSTKKVVVPRQGIDEQFGDIVKPMINEIELLKNKNQILQDTRDLLLPRLISGKLSVEDLEIEEMNMAAEPETKY
ncbi:restriction endonuclease subunit S [Psychroserpens jangbogonensis]|uniref:restriction endonuclease subunit S n=1 Tax=Psychroserpens jangbogonensis TaxID=1484460 RepID=UPI0006902518|nr:restriction endonuclease subunit S [Psychroserpens jangbogonensis]